MSALLKVIRSWLLVHRKKQIVLTTNQPGFTLIELMLAISIVAIISTIGLVTYSKAQLIARDAKRKQDLRSIAIALEIYYQKNKRYPCTVGWQQSTNAIWITDITDASCPGTVATKLAPDFINKMPTDPINDPKYLYQYYSYGGAWPCPGAGQSYFLMAPLENQKDPDLYGTHKFPICALNAQPGADDIKWANDTFLMAP